MYSILFFVAVSFLSTRFGYCGQHVEDLLLQNEQITQPYLAKVMGKQFWIYPQNFGSETFPDTVFYAQNIPISAGAKFLEMGSGTGIISVAVALRTDAQVTAIDINPYAVANTTANAQLHDVSTRLVALEGNLFSSLSLQDKFDVIFFNVPALDTEKKELTWLEQAIYDPGYQILEQYINEAPAYLTSSGRFFVGFSPIYGDLVKFKEIAEKKGYRLESVIQDKPSPHTMFELVEVIIPK